MKAYRSAWHTLVVVLAAVAFVAGGTGIGWPSFLGAAAVIAVTGTVTGLAWVEADEGRAKAVVRVTLWFGVGGVLLLGLPTVLGGWALLATAAVGALSPPVVGLAWRASARRRPGSAVGLGQLPVRDLERRWLRTSVQLRVRRSDPTSVLALVEERAALLEEIERRDPDGFEALLVRSGWHEPQDR